MCVRDRERESEWEIKGVCVCSVVTYWTVWEYHTSAVRERLKLSAQSSTQLG